MGKFILSCGSLPGLGKLSRYCGEGCGERPGSCDMFLEEPEWGFPGSGCFSSPEKAEASIAFSIAFRRGFLRASG